LEYVRGVAEKYGVGDKVAFETKVLDLMWFEDMAEWTIEVEKKGEKGKRTFNVVINATGCLNNWKWPGVQGLNDFEGTLMHSANWDNSWYVFYSLLEKHIEGTNFLRGTTLTKVWPSSVQGLRQFKSSLTCRRNVKVFIISYEDVLGSASHLAELPRSRPLQEMRPLGIVSNPEWFRQYRLTREQIRTPQRN
jgi:hypothetical protein